MNDARNRQKLRGGYYTPELLARFLARWAVRTPTTSVLEPSCGDGNLLIAAAYRLAELGAEPSRVAKLLYGVELNADEASKCVERLRQIGLPAVVENRIHVGDFFAHCQDKLFEERLLTLVTREGARFDAVVGNPPFIRYQDFPEAYREIAFKLMEEAGVETTRLANAWLPFLVVSSVLLEEHGRLAMVLPASLFQVSYAAEAREFLSEFYERITLITFERLVFEGIQQDVVLLLAAKNSMHITGIRSIELKSAEDLASLSDQDLAEVELKPMDHSTEKWTQYFLETEEIQLLRELRQHPGVTISSEVMEVNVGVVTGRNDFFILTAEEVERLGLQPYVKRVVSRSADLRGAVFAEADWKENKVKQQAVFLFAPPDEPVSDLPPSIQDYVREGEAQGVHEGYKCRIRDRWYIVPSVWVPDAFLLRQVHDYPKLVLNRARATCTDTIHRVRFGSDVSGEAVSVAFLNSLTFAFSEVTGRSYGGGVMTFEPSEAENLPLPLAGADRIDISTVDELLRQGNIESVLDLTDRVLLMGELDLSAREVRTLRDIWAKMRDRRINRK